MHTTVRILAVLLLAAGAAAAQTPVDYGLQRQQLDHCNRLVWQFDNAVQRPLDRTNLERARKSRDTGERLCRSRNPEGMLALEAALIDIGIKPLPRP